MPHVLSVTDVDAVRVLQQCDMTEEMRQETMDAVCLGVEKFADNMEVRLFI